MDGRSRRYEISRPHLIVAHPLPPPPVPTVPPPRLVLPEPEGPTTTKIAAPAPPPLAARSRPLSDICELSEPSVAETVFVKPAVRLQESYQASQLVVSPWGSPAQRIRDHGLPETFPFRASIARERESERENVRAVPDGSSEYSVTPESPNFCSIPKSTIPHRSSSQGQPPVSAPVKQHMRRPSTRSIPPRPLREASSDGWIIPNRGHSRSPVKQAGLRSDAVRSGADRRVPSRTHVRPEPSLGILQYPTHRHPRVKLELRVKAPLFVGGGSVDGSVRVTVDDNCHVRHRRSLTINTLSVDLVGFEDVSGGRKAAFLALGSDLLDLRNPPPADMTGPANPLVSPQRSWNLLPCTCDLAFMLSLPLDTGPPAFSSRRASIRFQLSATARIRDGGKSYEVRTSEDISVLPTYDPETALRSLPSPLTASDTLACPRFGRCQTLSLTAGLHRQVWVSGGSIFVDVHIANKTHKPVKRLDLALERDILCYKHAAANTGERFANAARIFESNERSVVARASLRPSNSTGSASGAPPWHGVDAHLSETRTHELELPRGHATVRCGKHFEVRFFLNITAALSATKTVAVQLPIMLVHINSLDVVPNCVAQVAAAMEEKKRDDKLRRTGSRPSRRHARRRSPPPPPPSSSSATVPLDPPQEKQSFTQGRAFAVPRCQSAKRQRARNDEMDTLRRELDASPRKHFQASSTHRPAVPKANHIEEARQRPDTDILSSIANMPFRTPPRRQRSKRDDAISVEGENKSRSKPLQTENTARSKTFLKPSPEFATVSKPHFTAAQDPEAIILKETDAPQQEPNPPLRSFRVMPPDWKGSTMPTNPPSVPYASLRPTSRPATSMSTPRKKTKAAQLASGALLRRKGTTGSLRERGRAWLMARVRHHDPSSPGVLPSFTRGDNTNAGDADAAPLYRATVGDGGGSASRVDGHALGQTVIPPPPSLPGWI